VKKQTNNRANEPEILAPEPLRKPTGRPSSYTFEVSEEICQQMAGGKGLRQICAQEGMPSRPTVLRWLEDNAGFRDRYARAREQLMDWYSEEILRIAFDDSGDLILNGDRPIAGHHVVQRARLKVDTVKWVMSKLHPGRYGDRPAIDADDGKQITFSWIKSDPVVEPAPAPPKQIEYKRPELPADLTEAEWSKLLQILEVAKRVAPSDSVPADVLEVIRKALLAHYAEDDPPPVKRIALPRRGRSGK
jgi:hypothetical protein